MRQTANVKRFANNNIKSKYLRNKGITFSTVKLG